MKPAEIVKQAFPDLGQDDIDALSRLAQLATYPPNTRLCHEGALEDIFYILAEGKVAVSQKMVQDDTHTLITLSGPGKVFGHMAVIENKPRAANVYALTPVTVLEISRDVLMEMLGKSPVIAMTIIRQIMSDLRATDRSAIEDLRQKNIELTSAYDDLKKAQSELVEKEKLERELELAKSLQRSMLPEQFPEVPGYSFSGCNIPARYVGGDLYDVLKIDNEHYGLLIADVSDKGVHAALFMALTRALFVAQAERLRTPAETTLAVHHNLFRVSSNLDMFVTVFYGVLNTSNGEMCYIRAGHDRPLLFRTDGSQPVILEARGRFIGGGIEDLILEERVVKFLPGDLFIAYSDGVTDAVNEKNESYTLDRLIACISPRRSLDASKICQMVLDDIYRFRGQAIIFDDITLLVASLAL